MTCRKDDPPDSWPYVIFSQGNRTWEEYVVAVPRVGDYVRLLPGEYSSISDGYVAIAVVWLPDHTKYDAEVQLRVDCE